MKKYLVKLDQKIIDNDWSHMLVIADNKSFTRVYQSGTVPFNKKKILNIYQSNVKRFANKQMAYINIICQPDGAKLGMPWVLSIYIYVKRLNDKAMPSGKSSENWTLRFNMFPEDLVKKKFSLNFVKKLVFLAKDEYLTSSPAGISGFKELREALKTAKEDYNEVYGD